MPYTISSSTKVSVTALFNAGRYADAYRLVRNDLRAQNATAQAAGQPPVIDRDTVLWYTNAPEINDPTSDEFTHHFVRNYVDDYARMTTGTPIDPAIFQNVSDKLAQTVLSG